MKVLGWLTHCEKKIPRVLIYPNTFIQGQYVYSTIGNNRNIQKCITMTWFRHDIYKNKLVLVALENNCLLTSIALCFFKTATCVISWFVTGVTRRVSLVEQELFIVLEYFSSPSDYCRVPIAQSLIFFVMLFSWLFVILPSFILSLCCMSFYD